MLKELLQLELNSIVKVLSTTVRGIVVFPQWVAGPTGRVRILSWTSHERSLNEVSFSQNLGV